MNPKFLRDSGSSTHHDSQFIRSEENCNSSAFLSSRGGRLTSIQRPPAVKSSSLAENIGVTTSSCIILVQSSRK